MYIYFAQFMPAEDKPGAYCVDFPDLPGCSTFGDSLAEALANAKECLASYLEASIKDKEDIPMPSLLREAQKKAEANCARLDINIPEGTFYQAVQPDPIGETPLPISISLLPSTIQIVDNAAKETGMTRSSFLAFAAKKCAAEIAAT